MKTRERGTAIVSRVFLAAVLLVDAARGLELSMFIGKSVARHIDVAGVYCLMIAWGEVLGAGLLVLGLLTRAVSVGMCLLWCFAASAGWARVGTLGTARALDDTLMAAAVVLISLHHAVRGAGVWSLDAGMAGSARRRGR
jgi:uncharacterized membrane protein YphA (DoxX/SURF4 family)